MSLSWLLVLWHDRERRAESRSPARVQSVWGKRSYASVRHGGWVLSSDPARTLARGRRNKTWRQLCDSWMSHDRAQRVLMYSAWLITCKLQYRCVYTVSGKIFCSIFGITSSNIGRFSKFFHCHNFLEICNKVIIKYLTTPYTRRYTTLWKSDVRKLYLISEIRHIISLYKIAI